MSRIGPELSVTEVSRPNSGSVRAVLRRCPMSSKFRVPIGAIGLALLAFVFGSRTASAQCFISGPFEICPGESAELCGPPEGDYSLEWTLPDGSHTSDRCVPVTG